MLLNMKRPARLLQKLLENKVKGMVKENVGGTIGDERMETQGRATKLKGENQMRGNE